MDPRIYNEKRIKVTLFTKLSTAKNKNEFILVKNRFLENQIIPTQFFPQKPHVKKSIWLRNLS